MNDLWDRGAVASSSGCSVSWQCCAGPVPVRSSSLAIGLRKSEPAELSHSPRVSFRNGHHQCG
jgi:hypothetical protein